MSMSSHLKVCTKKINWRPANTKQVQYRVVGHPEPTPSEALWVGHIANASEVITSPGPGLLSQIYRQRVSAAT